MPEAERKGFPDLIDSQTEEDLLAMHYAEVLGISPLEVRLVSPHWISSARTKLEWQKIKQTRQPGTT